MIIIDLDTKIIERGVELVLAILLFIDATEVPGGILARERTCSRGCLVIALPLSLILAWLAGLALFSEHDAWLLAVLAIIVVPVDLAPAVAILRDRRVPERLREIMNVEAGAQRRLRRAAVPVLPGRRDGQAHARGRGAGERGAADPDRDRRRRGDRIARRDRAGLVLEAQLDRAVGAAARGAGAAGDDLRGGDYRRTGTGSWPRLSPGSCSRCAITGCHPESLQLAEDVGALLSLCVWFVFGGRSTRCSTRACGCRWWPMPRWR